MCIHVCYHVTTGSLLFIAGMAINIHSDHILRSLRCQSDAAQHSSYQIPRGTCVMRVFACMSGCVCVCIAWHHVSIFRLLRFSIYKYVSK